MPQSIGHILVACLAAMIAVVVPPPASADGDPMRGRKIYERCQACHSIDRNRAGPKHAGLFGRRAGTVAGFDYTDAMKRLGVVWNENTLDWFLKAPTKAVPGTAMGFDGIKDVRERADLIAYLRKATGTR